MHRTTVVTRLNPIKIGVNRAFWRIVLVSWTNNNQHLQLVEWQFSHDHQATRHFTYSESCITNHMPISHLQTGGIMRILKSVMHRKHCGQIETIPERDTYVVWYEDITSFQSRMFALIVHTF